MDDLVFTKEKTGQAMTLMKDPEPQKFKRGLLFLKLLSQKNETAIPIDDINDNGIFPILVSHLQDSDTDVRYYCVYILGKCISLGVIEISFVIYDIISNKEIEFFINFFLDSDKRIVEQSIWNIGTLLTLDSDAPIEFILNSTNLFDNIIKVINNEKLSKDEEISFNTLWLLSNISDKMPRTLTKSFLPFIVKNFVINSNSITENTSKPVDQKKEDVLITDLTLLYEILTENRDFIVDLMNSSDNKFISQLINLLNPKKSSNMILLSTIQIFPMLLKSKNEDYLNMIKESKEFKEDLMELLKTPKNEVLVNTIECLNSMIDLIVEEKKNSKFESEILNNITNEVIEMFPHAKLQIQLLLIDYIELSLHLYDNYDIYANKPFIKAIIAMIPSMKLDIVKKIISIATVIADNPSCLIKLKFTDIKQIITEHPEYLPENSTLISHFN